MRPPSPRPRPPHSPPWPTLSAGPEPDSLGTLFAGLFGLLLGVGLLKFGNPVNLDRLIDLPRSLEEWRVFAWPIRIGHGLLAISALAGAGFILSLPDRRPRGPRWILGLLAGWLLWQCAAALSSIDPPTTRIVLTHFAACALAFALGHGALSRVAEPRVFWLCLCLGFLAVLAFAAEQHFGGLAATRKMILEQPQASNLPPEYLARIQSNRVFSTLVYPNALAGAILLLLPATVILVARWGTRWRGPGGRLAALAILAAGSLVLVWSGSKAGWLVAMGLLLVVLAASSTLPRRLKVLIAAAFLVAGLTAFLIVFREKLSRGPTSVAARVDYWTAAWQGFQERPILGQGPGAFKRVYARVKRPESEMAQLAHNDYLQQATDSGWPGFLAYLGFVVGSLGHLYRERRLTPPTDHDPLLDAVSLGLLGWFTHGLVEFGLYIPATAWCAFALLGWALAFRREPRLPSA